MSDFNSKTIDDEVSITVNQKSGMVYIDQDGGSVEVTIDTARKLLSSIMEMIENE